MRAGHVGADEVARDQVARRGRDAVLSTTTPSLVSGDDIARAGGHPADGVARTRSMDHDAVVGFASGDRAGGVGADVVALDQVARGGRGAGALDADAVILVSRDDVAARRRSSRRRCCSSTSIMTPLSTLPRAWCR